MNTDTEQERNLRNFGAAPGVLINSPETQPVDDTQIMQATTDIICAYVSNNPVSTNELPSLISATLETVKNSVKGDETKVPNTKPAVPIKQSLNDDFIICLEDGQKFKSLKRHLRSHFDLSPEQYREKWGLPADYPMVAPNYAKRRSQLARDMGLGRKPGQTLKEVA